MFAVSFRGLLVRRVPFRIEVVALGLAARPSRVASVETSGFPGSWDDPYAHALFSDPGWTFVPRLDGTSGTAFRSLYVVGSIDSRFRGSFTRPAHSLSTLRSPGFPGSTTQDSLPAGGYPLLCGSLIRRVIFERFRLRSTFVAFSFPRLAWRTEGPGGEGQPTTRCT